MSQGRSIVRNVSLLLGGKAIAGIVSTIYIVIVTRALGPHDFGILVLVNGYVVTVAGIVAFSGWHGIVRYGAQAVEAGNTPRLMRLVRFMTLVELACALAAMITAFLLAPLAGHSFGWPPEVVHIARFYAVAVTANMLTTPHGLLQLGNRFDRLGVHPALAPLVRLAGTLLVWWQGGGLIDYLLVWLVSAVSEGLFMWLLAWSTLRKLRATEPMRGPVAGVIAENPGLRRFLITTNADLTLRDLAPKLVPLIVGWMLGPAAAGIYSLAQRAAVVLQQPAVQLSQAGYPVIAKLLASGDRAAAIRLTWRTSATALAVVVPLVLVLAFFSRQILQLLGGTAFGGGAFLFILLAVGRAAQLGAVPISSALIAMGRTASSIIVNLCTNLGLLPFLPVALSLWGVAGAGWHGLVLGVCSLVALALVFRGGNQRAAPLEPDSIELAFTDEQQGLTDG